MILVLILTNHKHSKFSSTQKKRDQGEIIYPRGQESTEVFENTHENESMREKQNAVKINLTKIVYSNTHWKTRVEEFVKIYVRKVLTAAEKNIFQRINLTH